MLIAGVFGVILYQVISFTLPHLGSLTMMTFIITGQLLAGMLVDHFGLFGVACHPITPTRIAGMATLLLGGYLISK